MNDNRIPEFEKMPRPATLQRRLEKSVEKDLWRVEVLALLGWWENSRGRVLPKPLLKRLDLVIRNLTKTRRALSPPKRRT